MKSGRGLGQDEHPRPAPKHGKDKTPLLKALSGSSRECETDLGKPQDGEPLELRRKPYEETA